MVTDAHDNATRFSAWFRCFDGCGERYPLTEVILRCRRCGSLLDVEHDRDAWRTRDAATWRTLLDARTTSVRWPDPSGVWAQREWVLPELIPEEIVSLGEGRTPLVPMPRLGAELGSESLYIKQCGHNPTGSFKDLGMTALVSMVQALRRRGVAIPAIACASTGDTSAALAAYAARAGVPAIVFLPAGQLSDEQLTQPLSHFAVTCALDTDFDGCMKLVAEFCTRRGVYLANSMNPLRIEGQKTLSIEICQQLGWQAPDWVVVPGGNLGHVTAIGKGFELLRTIGIIDRMPRLCVAQAAAASPLYDAFKNDWRFSAVRAQPTQASAIRIGDPVNVHKAMALLKREGGVVERATEEEITEAWVRGDRHGLYADPHTGVALSALRKLAGQSLLKPTERVVVISTAHGLKFGAMKRQHHASGASASDRSRHLAEAARTRNPPLTLPAEIGALEAALAPVLST
jgi:threonine synthase